MLSLVETPVGFVFGAFLGTVALLLAALVIIRLMPDGMSACAAAPRSTGASGSRERWPCGACCTGPEDIGQTPLVLAAASCVLLAFFVCYPRLVERVRSDQHRLLPAQYADGTGLGLLWGYCGVSSFGQVAYFGVAGYVYGIIAGNLDGQCLGAAGRLAGRSRRLRRSSAAVFGYFVFYGRVQNWIVPILTLVFTLLLETFLGQTAGYQWRVGTVQLGGYNGMTGIPSFQLGELVVHRLQLLLLRARSLSLVCFRPAGCWSTRSTAR